MRKGSLLVFTLLLLVSCVTVNIYFPAEEVKQAADKIVEEVWGDQAKKPEDQPSGDVSLWQLFGPATAYAQQNIDVTTPQIRAIKQSIKSRAGSLQKFMSSGNVGLGNDGLLVVRNTDGLGLKEVSTVKKLVAAENSDRQRLYQEISAANGFPGKAAEVQTIFAKSWREQAAPGWYIQKADGSWSKR